MSIRDAVNAVPAKPIIATAVIATVLAASWHGYNLHRICTHRADLTSSLKSWAANAVASGTPSKLSDAISPDWDNLRIVATASAPANSTNCPFEWHWSTKKRQSMARDGHLSLLGFFRANKLLEIVDFDSRWARFDVSGDPITRDQAVFVRGTSQKTLQLHRP
jgi:hypothetical protein